MPAGFSASSLQKKVSATLLAVMAVLAVLSYAILEAVVAPAFDNLEQQSARTNLVRAERALGAELASLSRLAIDWAPWDDSYRFVQGNNPAFERSNLLLPTLIDLDLDLMLFYNNDGDLHWGRYLLDEQPAELASSGVFGIGAETERRLLNHKSIDSKFSGLLDTRHGPMLMTSRPILTTDGLGPSAGTLILGRFLDHAMQQEMLLRTEVDFRWHQFDTDDAVHVAELEKLQTAQPGAVQVARQHDRIDAYSLLRDVNGAPLLVLHATTPRSISAVGTHTLNGALLQLAVLSLTIALLIGWLMHRIIVKPLEGLATHITDIRESGDLSKKLHLHRDDEIGALARQFDEMTGELDDARKLLLEQAFKAGKADLVAEVLHNIRNAMTPLINGIDRLGAVCSVTKSLKIGQATEQLADPDCPRERHTKLLHYVDSAFRHVTEVHAEGEKELKAVSRQARQVEAILSDQEKHAKVAPITENISLDEMLDEAVLVIPKRKKPEISVELAEDLRHLRVKAHRVGLLQVLGNLILNAYESIQRSAAESGRIMLTACSEAVNEQAMVRLVVSDTGCGFDPQQKQKIFQRGYSSKDGHRSSGLGLHWCANAIAGMGGRIHAESTGDGQGAAFHVLLPAAHGG